MSATDPSTTQASSPHCAATGANSSTPDENAPAPSDELRRTDLTITGMTCGHCVTAVRDALASLEGVQINDVRIGSASVTVAPDGASPLALVQAIREAGYQAAVGASDGVASTERLTPATAVSSCCAPR